MTKPWLVEANTPADAINSMAVENSEPGKGDAPATPAAREAPTEQQASRPGAPKRIVNAQTVCNERNEKNKPCHGFLKQLRTGGEPAEVHLSGDDVLYKCQTCGTLYAGPPLGHLRDPSKQERFVQKELTELLQAAGGTLPAFKKSPTGAWVPIAAEAKAPHEAPRATDAPARAVVNSSPAADAHRPAAEAQAATGQASAAPLSPAASAASPAAGAETPGDLAPGASTELTPGAPKDETK